LRLFAFQDGFHVQAASSSYPNAVGARVVAITGTPTDEVFDVALSVTHGDNAMSKWQFAPKLLTVPALPWGLGTVPAGEGARFELEDPEGQHVTLEHYRDGRDAALGAILAHGAAAP